MSRLITLGRGLADPAAILYIEGSGTFDVTRIEIWPGPRTLLVLRVWHRALADGKARSTLSCAT